MRDMLLPHTDMDTYEKCVAHYAFPHRDHGAALQIVQHILQGQNGHIPTEEFPLFSIPDIDAFLQRILTEQEKITTSAMRLLSATIDAVANTHGNYPWIPILGQFASDILVTVATTKSYCYIFDGEVFPRGLKHVGEDITDTVIYLLEAMPYEVDVNTVQTGLMFDGNDETIFVNNPDATQFEPQIPPGSLQITRRNAYSWQYMWYLPDALGIKNGSRYHAIFDNDTDDHNGRRISLDLDS